MKRSTLRETTTLVKYILTVDPATRDDDPLLYYRVCEYRYPDILNRPFGVVLKTMQVNGITPFETVRRSRQNVQRNFPELKGTKRARAKRTKNEKVYRRYAREKLKK